MSILRIRVITALELAPMTTPQLAKCLDARPTYVQRIIADLCGAGAVRETGSVYRRHSRPEKLWSIAA
jgi:predicted transcriptional regulator